MRITGRGAYRPTSYMAVALTLMALCLWQPSAARAQWATSGSNISNSNAGNVGVGTANPGAKLDVGTGAGSRGSYTDVLIGGGGNNPQLEFYGTNKSAAIQYDEAAGGLLFYTNAPQWMQTLFLGNSGNVGVGTTSPANALHVHSASGAQALRVSGSGGAFMNFLDTAAGANQKLYQWRSEGGVFRMGLLNDAENAFVQQNILVANSAGSVGVGTASPGFKLDVQGGQLNASGGLCIAGDCKTSWSQLGGAGSGWTDAGASVNVTNAAARVGIGTAAPQSALHVVGDITVSGNINAKFQDVAEWVQANGALQAGTVVVLDTEHNNRVTMSSRVYDTSVAGVVSARPGLALGEAGEGKVLVATTGRVRVRVDATRSPISIGDLIVTSDVPGVAMKSIPVELGGVSIHRPGTIVGKALEPLAKGRGEILVLLSLQ